MSSAPSAFQKRKKIGRTSARHSYLSWFLILLGVALLIFAFVLAGYAFSYSPEEKTFTGNQRIERTPPPMPVEDSQPPPSPTISPSKRARERAGQRDTILRRHAPNVFRSSTLTRSPTSRPADKPRGVCHSVSSQPQTFSAPQASLTTQDSSPQPTATPTPEKAKKPNPIRRIINWLARLFKKKPFQNQPPILTFSASSHDIVLPCSPGTSGQCSVSASTEIQLTTKARDPDGDPLFYTYATTGGRITGTGANVRWDLSGAQPGTYTATVEVDDGCGCVSFSSTTVTVSEPPPGCCVPPCPTIYISCPTEVITVGQTATVSANVSGDPNASLTYNWTVSAGTISSGQDTPSITVDTTGVAGGTFITATLEVGGVSPECQRTASCTLMVKEFYQPVRYGSISGTVKNRNVPIAGATVVVRSRDGQIRKSASTDKDGKFRIDGLPQGPQYVLEITAAGLGTQTWSNLSLESGQNTFPTWEMGSPVVTPSPVADPSPQASASPSPSPSPSSSPAQTTAKTPVEWDKMTVKYPDIILEDTSAEVTFEIQVEKSGEKPYQVKNANGSVTVVGAAPYIAGAQTDRVLSENAQDYDTYLVVRLIPKGLIITSEPDNSKRLYTGDPQQWKWRIKPEGTFGLKASFEFEVDVIWQSKNTSETLPPQKVKWPEKPLPVDIGPPEANIKAATYSSPFVFLGGIAAIGYGNKKRKEDEDEEGNSHAKGVGTADQVTSSVYAPTEAEIGKDFLVQVFAHLAEQAEGLAEIAKAAEPGVIWRGAAKSKERIERGTELTFHLSMPGLEIDNPEQNVTWNGEPEQVQFIVKVPPDCQPGNVGGMLTVSRNTIPIGHLRFIIKLTGKIPEETTALTRQPVGVGTLVRYRQVFISYTRRDRWEVLKRVQMLELSGVDYFQDLLTLKPGDEFEALIYDYIDKSDLFLLFWSQAASESEWVRKEYLRAIKRKSSDKAALPEIKPVILEVPPAQPPEELSSINFDDKFMHLLNSENSFKKYFKWLVRNKLLLSVIKDIFRRSD